MFQRNSLVIGFLLVASLSGQGASMAGAVHGKNPAPGNWGDRGDCFYREKEVEAP